ncbi:MAG TPA: acetate/propionate family kinase, partial [bacterium]|nr:acetate/propionate family kinase [bacterium]
YQRYGIRRYGFHGMSHRYVSAEAVRLLGGAAGTKVITCHLGNGASIAAVADGKVLDTSMGFTPLEGLVMGTRCGDMDPAIILYLMAKEELTQSEANTLMNKHSGLQGLSGVSSDMRSVIAEMDLGNPRAQLAFDTYSYRVRKYIGSYTAALGGLDALVFTAGVGENAWRVREACCRNLACLGVTLDAEKNKAFKPVAAGDIAAAGSAVRIFVIPTNEELVIARDTRDIVFGKES